MSVKRKDSKGRILRTGESQRPDGRYCYKYIDAKGKQQFVYSWKLEPTDRLPKGKRDGPALREKEKEIQKDQLDGIDHTGANMTVLDLYQKHIQLNAQVKPSTVQGRERRRKMLENDPLGFMRISNVKLSDAKEWALRQQSKGAAYHTIRTDKRALKAAFYTAISDCRKVAWAEVSKDGAQNPYHNDPQGHTGRDRKAAPAERFPAHHLHDLPGR